MVSLQTPKKAFFWGGVYRLKVEGFGVCLKPQNLMDLVEVFLKRGMIAFLEMNMLLTYKKPNVLTYSIRIITSMFI